MQALKVLVIFMGVLIVAGMGLVAYGIAVKFGKVAESGEDPATAATGQVWPTDVRAAIPPGARVAEIALDDGRMVVRLTLADGSEMLLVFDLSTGARLGAIELMTQGGTQ